MENSIIKPVVLSGGNGSRLWPLSRKELPKQFWNLIGKGTLLEQTLMRFYGNKIYSFPTIVCNERHRFLVSEQTKNMEIDNIIVEPVGKNTAPAAVVACLVYKENDIILLIPSDHYIKNVSLFNDLVSDAIPIVNQGKIVTFGIVPNVAATGYGYIEEGNKLDAYENFFGISKFVEKPNKQIAEKYVSSGKYLWNCGFYMFKASTMLQEFKRYQPDVLDICKFAVANRRIDGRFTVLEKKSFVSLPNISIDKAISEKTSYGVVAKTKLNWCDIGSWEDLWKISPKDSKKNTLIGDVIVQDVESSYVRSEGPLICAQGIKDLVVVANNDAVIVTHKNYSQSVKDITNKLDDQKRDEHEVHKNRRCSWGTSQVVNNSDKFCINRISINPSSVMLIEADKVKRCFMVAYGVAKTIHGKICNIYKQGDFIKILSNNSLQIQNMNSDQFLELVQLEY